MISGAKLRTVLIFFLLSTCMVLIGVRLFFLQVKNSGYYRELGRQQYEIKKECLGPRALIVDRNGIPLAINRQALSAFIIPKQVRDKSKLHTFLSEYFPSALERWQAQPEGSFLFIKRRLTEEQCALIEQAGLPDIHLLHEPQRFYPLACAMPVVGTTNIDNQGLFGIELLFDAQLAGSVHSMNLLKEARSGCYYFDKQVEHEGVAGAPVKLTLDSDLQFLVAQQLEKAVKVVNAQEGAVLVIDPATGHIHAMVQYPFFNPNEPETFQVELSKNKIVTQAYELGSVMKTFLALALLEEKLITLEEEIDCLNTTKTTLHGIPFTTTFAHGVLPFEQVVRKSNNIGCAKAAERIGKKLFEHYQRLGFGKRTALNWPGEQAGFINPPQRWSKSSLIAQSFGYESMLTLLQLGQAFSMIAHNGQWVEPVLVIEPPHKPSPALGVQRYSAQAIAQVKKILELTPEGLAPQWLAAFPGWRMFGKTGTANMVIEGHYRFDHNIFTFAGILERGTFKRVIIAFIKDALYKPGLLAVSVARPLFDQVAHDIIVQELMTGNRTA